METAAAQETVVSVARQSEDLVPPVPEAPETPAPVESEKAVEEAPVVKDEIAEQPKAEVKRKRKKSRKIPKAKGHPKHPKNGYVRYCDFMRPIVTEELKAQNSELDPVEITKLVAARWYGASSEERQPYLAQYFLDKQRFEKELEAFKLLNPDCEILSSKKKKSKAQLSRTESDPSVSKSGKSDPQAATNNSSLANSIPKENDVPKVFIAGTDCELQIFNTEFLEHNKLTESQLKNLRKNCVEIEQENSVLMKHVENMTNGLDKVNVDIKSGQQRNDVLELYLKKLKTTLASSFRSLTEPTLNSGATFDNINEYMMNLNNAPSAFTNKASDILRKSDLNIDL